MEESASCTSSTRSFDLVSATLVGPDGSLPLHAEGLNATAHPSEADAEAAGNPPGVLPLVQALGRLVADHPEDRRAALAEDDRLWTLIDLLKTLARPGDDPRAAPDEARQTVEYAAVGLAELQTETKESLEERKEGVEG